MKTQKREQIQPISPPSRTLRSADSDQQGTMSVISGIPGEGSSPSQVPPPVPTHLSLAELKEQAGALKESLARSRDLVAEEEEELAGQAETIAQLQTKVKGITGLDRLNLEVELANEREKRELLEATLVGQRRNLRQQEAIYEKHWQALQQQQSKEKIIPLKLPAPKLEVAIEEQESPKEPEKLPRQWWRWTLVLVAAGIITTGATALYSLKLAPRQSPIAPAPTAELLKSRRISAIGYLEPAGEAITLSATATADGIRVQQLPVKLGDRVQAKQIVAILDNRDRLKAALQQAEAQVREAQVRLERVKAGAKTGEIQAQDAKLQQARAELAGQVAAQKAAIARLEAEFRGEKSAQVAAVQRISAELHNAQTECRRYQKLHQDGAVSSQERDRLCLGQETTEKRLVEARANLQRIVDSWQERIGEAKANLNRTVATLQRQMGEEQAMLDSVGEVRPVDVQVARAEIQSAQAAVQKARADLELAYVRAPRDGQILKIYTRPGEVVGDRGILVLGQTDQMYVKAEVYETDIRQVRAGQKARIESDGIVGDLMGTVEEVGLEIGRQTILNTEPSADVDSRVVEVRIRLSPQDSQRIGGLTNLQVNVIIDTAANKR